MIEDRIALARYRESDSLDLAGFGLTAVPSQVYQLKDLRELNLADNRIGNIPAEIAQLLNLEDLRLQQNSLQWLPTELYELRALRRLSLEQNQLKEVSAKIGQLSRLTDLFLDHNELTSVPDELGDLSDLQYLWLGNNNLRSLPRGVGRLSALQSLSIKSNQISNVPGEIGRLSELLELDMSENRLIQVPREIGLLSNLVELDMEANQIGKVPEEIGSLGSLQHLQLGHNQVRRLPDSIGSMKSLESLRVHSNRLTTVPPGIAQLSKLTVLRLDNNELAELPLPVCRISSLAKLRLHGNSLESLPSEIGRLVNLTVLSIDRNQLATVPTEIGDLVHLENLRLDGNQLVTIPPEIGNLGKLTDLRIDGNKLAELPGSIGELSSLRNLGLDQNELTVLPPEIGNLPNLPTGNVRSTSSMHPVSSGLTLGENPLPEEVFAAAGADIKTLGSYLERLAADGEPLWEAKLLFVGEGEVGKSTLLNALRSDPWVDERQSTHGLELSSLELPHPTDVDVNIKLNAWDFAGQPVYRATHQIFFTSPAVYVVVWKPRTGVAQSMVDFWLTAIKLRASAAARCLVVATHGGPENHAADINEAELIDSHGDLIAGFHTVESKDVSGFEDLRLQRLREAIASEAAGLPEMGRPFPASWTNLPAELTLADPSKPIEVELADDGQRRSSLPYLRYSDLVKRARDLRIDAGNVRALCAIATGRGQWIHYGEIERKLAADDLVVTQPQWLAKAISFVLDDDETRDSNGVLPVRRLPEIWDNPYRNADERYDPALYPIFLDLLQWFDLAYEISQEQRDIAEYGRRFLVSQLVAEKPNAQLMELFSRVMDPPAADRTVRKVRWIVQFFDTATDRPVPVPAGLLYQLIVRLHRFSLGAHDYRKALHWQRGVGLVDPLAGSALVTAHDDGLRIRVTGSRPEAFANFIASDIDQIVGAFWRGVSASLGATCGDDCGRGEPGRAVFDVAHLVENRLRDVPTAQCREMNCQAWPSVEELLSGYDPEIQVGLSAGVDAVIRREASSPDEASARQHQQLVSRVELLRSRVEECSELVTTQLAPYVSENLGPLHGKLPAIAPAMKEIAAQASINLDYFLLDTDELAHRGPRLISAHLDAEAIAADGRGEPELTITLWCEHSRVPLHVLRGESGLGQYSNTITQQFANAVLPYLRLSTMVAMAHCPVALLSLDRVLDESEFSAIYGGLIEDATSLELAATALRNTHGRYGSSASAVGDLDLRDVALQLLMLEDVQQMVSRFDSLYAGLQLCRDKQDRSVWVDPVFRSLYPAGGTV